VLVVADTPGSVALYAAAAAVALGAAVRYMDRDPARVDAARALGADASLHEGPWPKRFNPATITVDVTGDPAGLAAVIHRALRDLHRPGYRLRASHALAARSATCLTSWRSWPRPASTRAPCLRLSIPHSAASRPRAADPAGSMILVPRGDRMNGVNGSLDHFIALSAAGQPASSCSVDAVGAAGSPCAKVLSTSSTGAGAALPAA